MANSEAVAAQVARTAEGLDHFNTLSLGPEERVIVVAQGKQFQNADMAEVFRIPDVLQKPGPERVFRADDGSTFLFPGLKKAVAIDFVQLDDTTFQHLSVKQGVLFTLKIVKTKTAFVEALETPGVHLIYGGHARYGRGPCFGGGRDAPGEDWEEGTGPHPNDDGIFRMGFPFISVPAEEVLEHGYTANLVSADVKIVADDCDPDLRSHLGGLHARTAAEIHPELPASIVDADPTRKWWSFRQGSQPHVVLHAGWQNTTSAPDDLGSFDPQCRVFCHFGCTTFVHNYPVVRKLKKWVKSGNERYAYWTTNLAYGITPVYWLQHLFTYPKFNAFDSWEPSLKYATAMTNAMLAKDDAGYTVI